MVWAWLFYVLFAAACVPGIQVQPRCCATGQCTGCTGTTPQEWQVVIAGLETGPFGLCSHCADLNGTYIVTRRAASDFEEFCVWGYCAESPCPPLEGDPAQQGIIIQLRVQPDGFGGLNVFVEMTTANAACEFSAVGAAWLFIGRWAANRPMDQNCAAVSGLHMTAIDDPTGLGFDPNCNTYPNYVTQPTCVITAL